MSLIEVMEVHTTSSYNLVNGHTSSDSTTSGEVFRPATYHHWAVELPNVSLTGDSSGMYDL